MAQMQMAQKQAHRILADAENVDDYKILNIYGFITSDATMFSES